MTIYLKYKQGKKAEEDSIILIKTDGWHSLNFLELLELLEVFFKNEDKIYPKEKGFKGREMLFEAIKEVKNGGKPYRVCKNFGINVELGIQRVVE